MVSLFTVCQGFVIAQTVVVCFLLKHYMIYLWQRNVKPAFRLLFVYRKKIQSLSSTYNVDIILKFPNSAGIDPEISLLLKSLLGENPRIKELKMQEI